VNRQDQNTGQWSAIHGYDTRGFAALRYFGQAGYWLEPSTMKKKAEGVARIRIEALIDGTD
jgi:hypothetical protein